MRAMYYFRSAAVEVSGLPAQQSVLQLCRAYPQLQAIAAAAAADSPCHSAIFVMHALTLLTLSLGSTTTYMSCQDLLHVSKMCLHARVVQRSAAACVWGGGGVVGGGGDVWGGGGGGEQEGAKNLFTPAQDDKHAFLAFCALWDEINCIVGPRDYVKCCSLAQTLCAPTLHDCTYMKH